jgi:hypothetical protein
MVPKNKPRYIGGRKMKQSFTMTAVLAILAIATSALATGYNPPGGGDSTAVSGSSSNANASANTYVSVTPQSPVSSSSSSNNNIGIGVNNSPTNNQNSSLSLQHNPTTNQSINNNPAQNTEVGVGINNQPVNVAGGGHASASAGVSNAGNSMIVLDQSQENIDYYNRQHIGVPGVGAAPAAQMFDEWEKSAWNVSPIGKEKFQAGTEKDQAEFLQYRERIFKTYPASTYVELVGNLFDQANKKAFYVTPRGQKVGTLSVVLPQENTVEDALLYAVSLAMKNGADQVEVIQYGGRKKPTLDTMSIGFGGGASGLIGDKEKMAVSGGGGTNFGSSSIVKEEQPWLSVAFYKNGGSSKSVSIAPVEIKKKADKIPTAKKIN